MVTTIAVIGAGTMGSGITQVAAQNNFKTILFDLNDEVLNKAKISIEKNLLLLVSKQKITEAQKETIFGSILFSSDIKDCKAELIIEAIIEKIAAKVELFTQLANINNVSTLLATNTSSLSVSDIQVKIPHPERVVGMHFFNPAPVMKLVEVVKGTFTNVVTANTIYELCKKMGKTPVLCKDAPGFIVNRVARHYYLEAMKILESGIAGIEEIDMVMEALGFKMGPFKLMDLIGMDINLAVTSSLYDTFNQELRFKPSPIQIEKVALGELGRKTGVGFYKY